MRAPRQGSWGTQMRHSSQDMGEQHRGDLDTRQHLVHRPRAGARCRAAVTPRLPRWCVAAVIDGCRWERRQARSVLGGGGEVPQW
ncbi:hypothetical protein [Mycobacterium sp. 852013-50091_SCH5140682]|uniref:hypothetical protein n=1 Tax=Mycobacterium sp. 852013-50091_SCH5140682 TaxID=1834109 RepID=UPI0018D4D11E|nr:hypothetical protein [Mycobacterium sp. 852013-50091_SCH5140682]